jgi:hypothetical protein
MYVYPSPIIYNYIDCGIFSISSGVTSNSESFKQIGLSYTLPMEFATTVELDSLLTTNPPIYSSGAKTGPKGTAPCGLQITALGSVVPVGFYSQNVKKTAWFQDLIQFKRTNPDCTYPINFGDSGSAVIADFSGTSKILGLASALAGTSTGYFCRIDRITSIMNISAWDGTPKNFIDDNSLTYRTVVGGSLSSTLDCSGTTYYQMGLTYNSSPC